MRNKQSYDIQYAKDHIFRKNVTFNDTNTTDQMLLEHINRINEPFVSYVKKLILKDMKEEKK